MRRWLTVLAIATSFALLSWAVQPWLRSTEAPTWTAPGVVPTSGPAEPADWLLAALERQPLFEVGEQGDLTEEVPAIPTDPPVPLAKLLLTGIVRGRDSSVILEGLPGLEGAQRLVLNRRQGSVQLTGIAESQATIRLRGAAIRLALGVPVEVHP